MHRRGRSSASASKEELGLQRGRSTGKELGVGVSVDSGEARRGGRNSSSMREELNVGVEGGARSSTMEEHGGGARRRDQRRSRQRGSFTMREELGVDSRRSSILAAEIWLPPRRVRVEAVLRQVLRLLPLPPRPLLLRPRRRRAPDHRLPPPIQCVGHIQPFSCTLAIDGSSLLLLAFSENSPDLLDLVPQSVLVLDDDKRSDPLTLGTDVRSLFTPSPAALLERAATAREITLLNPI
ncbi:uncharacterized protein A4U43_C06F8870 [Asparagus officinalis]|uniref:PAS fold-2 domain-containing protein n=1 Tax=Asparagus officinalis TaxID=4686 RepID=A0A5P1ELG4_ASPOF|nr:uncharacterized protein A4U43_C06F8870 [Asparagus officinalis]